MDELDLVIVRQIVGGLLPIIYYGVYHLSYYLLLFMLDTLGPSAMISYLNNLGFHEFIRVLDPIYDLYAPMIVWNRRSQLKGHAPSCLVLVIDDNPYGLMACLSYTLRFVHRQCLKIIGWLQG